MTLTPEEIEAERERFEAWANDVSDRKFCLSKIGDEYQGIIADCHWQGWLAAIASERDRRKQEQDAAEALLAMQGWPEMKHMQENGE